MSTLTRLRNWLLAPIARQLSERNALLDMRNYIASGKLNDAEWLTVLRRAQR